jgi:hypothetical protein
MKKLLKLQADYKAGKLTKAQYDAAVADLLADETIDQDEHDEALEFDPEDGDEPLKYTQSEVDSFIVKKARDMVRKAAREAGLDVKEIKPQELLTKVAEMAAAGSGKEQETDAEVTALRKKAAAFDVMEPKHSALVVENAVLKTASKYEPVNPAQVVRALNADYKDLLEFDEETGALDPKSVQKAIKRIATVEPNLFNKPEDEDQGDDDLEDKQEQSFSGKPPGGAGGGQSKQQKEATKLAAKKASALEMMGLSQEK